MNSLIAVALVVFVVALTNGYNLERRQDGGDQVYVAFSAGLSVDADVDSGTTIVFNKEYVDTANAYDVTTGIFTVPTHGMYTFIFHGLSWSNGQMWLDLMKNNITEETAYAHTVNDYAAASQSVSMECNQGDKIYISGHGYNTLYGTATEVYSSFSGFINVPLP